ncbi:MAG: hypothetical protein ACREJG_10930 [Candidatus Rokuibacteriota bacterium]
MLRVVLLAVVFTLVGGTVASAQVIELEGRYWLADIDARARVENDSLPGTRVDFDDDLGVEGEGVPDLRLTIFTGLNSKIRLAYAYLSFEGEETLDRSIEFAGSTFSVNMQVDTDVDIHYARLGWAWQFLAVPGVFKLGPLLEAKGFLFDTSLRTRGVSPEVRESHTFPLILPTVGLAVDFTPHPSIHLFAEASGLPAGDLGYFLDAEAGIRLILFRTLALSASYRLFDVRVEDGSDFARLEVSGPAFGAALRF